MNSDLNPSPSNHGNCSQLSNLSSIWMTDLVGCEQWLWDLIFSSRLAASFSLLTFLYDQCLKVESTMTVSFPRIRFTHSPSVYTLFVCEANIKVFDQATRMFNRAQALPLNHPIPTFLFSSHKVLSHCALAHDVLFFFLQR